MENLIAKGFMLLALAGSALTSSCATDEAGGRSFSLVGEQQEMALGNQTAQEVIKAEGVYEHGAIEGYLNDVMARLHKASDIAAKPISLVLLDTDSFNASATPGYMMVNRGLLPWMNSEAQLAAILGHEIGHNAARHVGETVTRGMVAQLGLALAGAYLGSKVENRAVAQGLYTAAGLGAAATLMAYSRGQEHEADGLGLKYMARAGYDPREAAGAFAQMQATDTYGKMLYVAFEGRQPPADQFFGLLRSHPGTPERYDSIVRQAGGAPDGGVKLPPGVTPATVVSGPAADPQGQRRYYRTIDGMAFGPRVREGVLGRDYIAFDGPRFVWKFGDGFVSRVQKGEQGQSVWQIVNPLTRTRAQAIFLTKAGRLNPASVLAEMTGGKLGAPQNMTVAGAVAATVSGRLNTGERVRAVALPLPASDMMAVMMYHFADGVDETPVMAALQQSVRLTEAQAGALKPLRLKIATAVSGDSVERLAARLPQGALRVELLQSLNGWQPGEAPKAGSLYKTIADPNGF